MIYIAHRGNLLGPNPSRENHPDYIAKALYAGFEVEVDVWYIDEKYYLGHDGPQYEVKEEYLYNERFWTHAKNAEALSQLMSISRFEDISCFFHNTDDCVLTSTGWIWTYPGKPLVHGSIAVMPERVPNWDLACVYGICTDYPIKYKLEIDK